MQFTIDKKLFRDVLYKIQGLTNRRTSLVMTECVLISTTTSGITIEATDMETGLSGQYPASVEKDGSILVNAKKLYEIVKDFPEEKIHLNEIENRWIEIGTENIEYHIVGMGPEDFPELPEFEDVDFFEIESATLRKMIEKTILVTPSPDDKRSHMLGVYFEKIFEAEKKNILRAVSTDGGRLALVDCPFPMDYDLPLDEGVLVPKKGLSEIVKFLEPTGIVQIGIRKNHFIVKKATEIFIVRLIDGDFPAYHSIARRREDAYILEFDRELMMNVLRRMSILSSEEYRGVLFNFRKDKLLVTASNPEIGESKEEVNVDYDGDPLEVAFNAKFLLEFVGEIEGDSVLMHICDKKKPCIVEGRIDHNYKNVIMPMQI